MSGSVFGRRNCDSIRDLLATLAPLRFAATVLLTMDL